MEKIGLMLNSTEEMADLIELLLLFSKVTREPVKKRRVDPLRLARETLRELQDEVEGRTVTITIDALPPALADRTLLKHVLANLLGNALKFTRAREEAIIHVGAEPSLDGTVYFVRDNGVGFDDADAASIFLPFYRLRGAGCVEGSGIGLALVKRIIERHSGQIWAEGEAGRGATFFSPWANDVPSVGRSM